MENPPENPSSGPGGMSQIGDDLLQNILAKLQAKTFASAACVSRAWNAICNRILSRPKLTSALSLNPFLTEALKEVVGKVLSGPIRPHFAILCICPTFSLEEAHRLITEKLGSSIQIITCDAAGIIGRDSLMDQFGEMMFPHFDVDDDLLEPPICGGISLTVGYIPGLKVYCIPLLHTVQGPGIDEFVINIRNYAASVSGHMSPEAIIMFGDSQADMKPVLEKLDYGLSKHTIIAGNESCRFWYTSTDNSRITSSRQTGPGMSYDAVALVFAREKTKPDGLGSIEFHFSIASGVSAVGPTYKVASAKLRSRELTTWLTAKREGENVALDGQQMLDDVDMEMGDPVLDADMYIGVTKRRKYSIGSEKVKSVTSVAYHPVMDGDEEYLFVRGLDIKTGDSFRFYVPDPNLAVPSCAAVAENFGGLKHEEIIGGFIFACCGRGETFFEKPNMDSSPVFDTFPCASLTGMFCGGEIGRGPLVSGQSDDGQEQGSARSSLHVYSSVYLLMSYNPPCGP